MKNYFYFLIIVSLFCLSSNCKEDKFKKCKDVLNAPQEYLDYWFFKEGTWWVYQLKDTTGIYDTVRVVYYDAYYEEYDDGNIPCKMFYNITYENTFYEGKLYWYSSSLINPNKWLINESSASTMFIFSLGEQVFFYPFSVGEIFLFDTNRTIADTNFLVTPVDTFYNTVHIIREIPIDTPIFINEYYITKNIGITKYIFTNNKTWELINFNIVK